MTVTDNRVAADPFVTYDPRFADVLGPRPDLVPVIRADAHEGPVYVAGEDCLYFTTVPLPGDPPVVRVMRLRLDGDRFPVEPARLSVVPASTTTANGMTLDVDGRLLVCEQGSRAAPARISALDPATGRVYTVVDGCDGLPLNSPNDVVVASDGAVWFTDPSYGHLQGFRDEPRLGDRVYRYDRGAGRLDVVVDGIDKPNGLVFSPDERILYVVDSGRSRHVMAFDVRAGTVTGGRVFARIDPGFPDGMAVDRDGHVYVSSASGVQVFAPDGAPLGEIRLPGAVNFTFGGPGNGVLFITTDAAVWAAVLRATGPGPNRKEGRP